MIRAGRVIIKLGTEKFDKYKEVFPLFYLTRDPLDATFASGKVDLITGFTC
jgi:hypothetical protein